MSAVPPFLSRLSATDPLPATSGFLTGMPPGKVCVACEAAKKAKRTPCDVTQLVLENLGKGGVNLRAQAVLRGQPLAANVPPHVRDDLGSHDLVFERALDYAGRSDSDTGRSAKAPTVKLELRLGASFSGGCGAAEHPLIEMQALGPVDNEPKTKKSWKATQSEVLPILGRAALAAGNDVANLFAPLWVFGGEPQLWRVQALGCGIRDKGSAFTRLNALVRAYSRDEYELTYTFPAAFGFTGERKGSVNLQGERQQGGSWTSSAWGQTQQSNEWSRSRKNDGSSSFSGTESALSNGALSSRSNELVMGRDGQSQSYSQSNSVRQSSGNALVLRHTTSGTKTEMSLADGVKDSAQSEQAIELRPGMTIKKNGRELDVSKFLNNLLNLAAKIKKAVEDIQKLVPSVGWKVSLDLKLLEGSITGRWGVQNAEDFKASDGTLKLAYSGERYVAVRKYYGLDFNVVVFGATITGTVGVEVKVDAVFWTVAELVVKLELKLAGETALKWKVSSDVELAPPTLEATLKGTIGGVVKANVVGVHLVDAAASATGGFRFVGVPQVSLDAAPRIDSELSMIETEATYWGTVGKEPPQPVKVKIYDEQKLWSGNLFNTKQP